jgi:hypothetical protein
MKKIMIIDYDSHRNSMKNGLRPKNNSVGSPKSNAFENKNNSKITDFFGKKKISKEIIESNFEKETYDVKFTLKISLNLSLILLKKINSILEFFTYVLYVLKKLKKNHKKKSTISEKEKSEKTSEVILKEEIRRLNKKIDDKENLIQENIKRFSELEESNQRLNDKVGFYKSNLEVYLLFFYFSNFFHVLYRV